jgi:hypothetical protein
VAAALSPLVIVAALVLCVAGFAKLRSPAATAGALRTLGFGVGSASIRAFAVAELGLGLWCIVAPTAIACAIMACVYVTFSALTLVLTRRASSCGCFGDDRVPASIVQSILSLALALVCLAGVRWVPHGVGWMLERSPSLSAVLVVGTAGAVYGTVLAYTELPLVWHAWSPR